MKRFGALLFIAIALVCSLGQSAVAAPKCSSLFLENPEVNYPLIEPGIAVKTAVYENLLSQGHTKKTAKSILRRWQEEESSVPLRLDVVNKLEAGAALDYPDYLVMTKDVASSALILGLSDLPNFDAGLFVKAYLEVHRRDTFQLYQDFLIDALPLWIRSDFSDSSAKAVLDQGIVNIDWRWFLSKFPKEKKREYADILKKSLSEVWDEGLSSEWMDSYKALMFLVNVPPDAQPSKLAAHVKDTWVNLKKYQPITIRGLSVQHGGSKRAGCCENMINTHLSSLKIFSRKDLGFGGPFEAPVLIEVDGKIVGALKTMGDPSMVALRNARNEKGELVLALGGVYEIPREVFEDIDKRFGEEKSPKRGFFKIRLDKLPVLPKTFLLNSNALSFDNQHKNKITELAQCDRSSCRDKIRRNAWPKIMKKLNAFVNEHDH